MLSWSKHILAGNMATYTVQQIDLSKSNQVKSFLGLPEMIYRDTPQWVPPLQMDMIQMLHPIKNPFYQHSRAAFFMAVDAGNRPLARLACLNNQRYNQYNHENTAFFYLFEAVDQPAVVKDLFEYAVDWARKEGLNKILGPKGFTALDGMGLLVEGFDHRPAFGIPYNPAYYAALIENAGFGTCGETLSGFITSEVFIDQKIDLIAQRVQDRRGLRIAAFRNRKDLRKLLPMLESLYNNAIQGTNGNVPITSEEAKTMADQILWLSDPSLIKIVMKEDRPVGFLFAYPDVSGALQRSNGRLFPFGWLHLLRELRTTNCIDINGAGMIEEYRGSGGTAILFNELRKSIQNSRYTHAEIVQIGVENERMLRELSSIGITFHKKHRIYSKNI
jgi:hypothetical protein